jgi:hypothetical protein
MWGAKEDEDMDEQEYRTKYVNLRILKSVQEYLKSDSKGPSALHPIRVPDELLYQMLQQEGAEAMDELIHEIFKLGLSIWSEDLYEEIFGSQKNLEKFIEIVKKRTREET